MSQRESGYVRKERDLYETPEWVTEALIPHLPRPVGWVLEPACGSGKMVRALEGALPSGASVIGTDIEPGPCFTRADFLAERGPVVCDAIITNPPYEIAQQFIEHALRLAEPNGKIVAMLLRTDFDHAKGRAYLFRDCPAFSKKLVLMKRIAWFVEENGKPKASPSFNHAWYIWDWKHEGAPTLAYGP
jgi:SAM-dependent methyltransferase